jgi:hypothetical protein
MQKQFNKIIFRLLIPVILGLMISSCATTPKVYTNQDPAADFTGYRTYAFDDPLGTDKSGYSSLLSQYLKTAVSREMESRGYALADDPDLIVNFYVHTQEKIQTTQTPTTGGSYYGYRGSRYGTWGGYTSYETRVTQHTEGTINVDLVDKKRGQLVWESELVGRVTDKVRENLESTVDQAIAEIFVNYPYRMTP